MTYSIEILEQAERDLRNIFEYIANTLQAPQSVVSQLERLEKRIYSLDQMPNRHLLYDKEPWRTRGLRVMVVDNYCVFYLPDTENVTVNIHRGALWEKRFKRDVSISLLRTNRRQPHKPAIFYSNGQGKYT